MSPKKNSVKKTMGLNNIKSIVSKNLPKIEPKKFIDNTKNKIENYYIKLKKDREKEKLKSEKKRKLSEKKEFLKQKKQEQKEKLDALSYGEDEVPDELDKIPIQKPGSRHLI